MINFNILSKAFRDVAVYVAICVAGAAVVFVTAEMWIILTNKFGFVAFPIFAGIIFIIFGIISRYEHHAELDRQSKKKMMDILLR